MGLMKRLKALQDQAMAMQEQAMAMHQASTGAGGGETAWDPTAFLPPPSEFVKRGTCWACGAAKQLPTVRQYLYCDFCGQLNDYDLRRAAEASFTTPTITTYAEIANRIGPQAERVRKAGDRETYRTLQHELYTAQTAYTPWVVPPRAWNDDVYRRKWIDYSTAVAVLGAFDPEQARLTDEVKSRALRLQWKGGLGLGVVGGMVASVRRLASGLDLQNMTPKAELSSFKPLAETVLTQVNHLNGLIRREGLHELDPDGGIAELTDRISRSALAQGWLTHLEPEDGQQFLDWLGLDHEYQRAAVHGEIRHCAGCGHDVTALPGATRVICDACGRAVDLAAPQVVCTACNARVAFVEGATHLHCPYCRSELRRV